MARITLWLDGRYVSRLVLIALLALIAFAHPPAHARAAKSRDLAAAVQAIDRALAEGTRKSLTYKLHGQLLTADLGSRVTSWSRPKRFLIDDFARHLRTLFFYAVCREHPTALKALAHVDSLILGGLFSANQRVYLADRAARLATGIRIQSPQRIVSAPPDNDLKSINRRNRLAAALVTTAIDLDHALLVPHKVGQGRAHQANGCLQRCLRTSKPN